MKTGTIILNHNESKTLLYMADDCIDRGEYTFFSSTKNIELAVESTQDERGHFDEDVELEVIIRVKRKNKEERINDYLG